MPRYRLVCILFPVFAGSDAVEVFESTGEALGTCITEIESYFKNSLFGSAKFKCASGQLIDPRVFYRTVTRMLSEDCIKVGE